VIVGSQSVVLDFDGGCRVERDDELLARLRSVLRGTDGSFILDHGGGGSLWVRMNGEDAAFLLFCPDTDGSHPGFVRTECGLGIAMIFGFYWWPETRRIQLLCGGGSCSRSMPPRGAAVEYLHLRSQAGAVT